MRTLEQPYLDTEYIPAFSEAQDAPDEKPTLDIGELLNWLKWYVEQDF